MSAVGWGGVETESELRAAPLAECMRFDKAIGRELTEVEELPLAASVGIAPVA